LTTMVCALPIMVLAEIFACVIGIAPSITHFANVCILRLMFMHNAARGCLSVGLFSLLHAGVDVLIVSDGSMHLSDKYKPSSDWTETIKRALYVHAYLPFHGLTSAYECFPIHLLASVLQICWCFCLSLPAQIYQHGPGVQADCTDAGAEGEI